MSKIELRDYQLDIDRFIDACKSNSILLTKPTGTGKTVQFMNYAIKRHHRTLVLVNSEELIDQAIEKAKMLDPHVSIGKFIGKERELDAQIIVASVATLKNINNLMLIDRDFSLIIYDEAHHAVSSTSKRILYAFGLCDLETAGHDNVLFVEPDIDPERKLIGVTATPERTDEISLSKIFKERIDAPNLEWFIENNYLCDLKFISVETGVDMSDVRAYGGDLSEKEMAQRFIDSGYLDELSRVISTYADECNSILLYVPDVETAKLSANLISKSGISCDYVIGAERDRRKNVIERFKNKEIRVLVNCLVLKEGFDAPNVDCIILCRPSKSKLLLRQIIGRGTRLYEDKTLCKIIDLVVQRREQDIISASGIFDDVELSEIEQESMTIKEKIEFQKQRAVPLTQLSSIAKYLKQKKELAEENLLKERQENERQEEIFFTDEKVPDSVMLLLDTRLLRVIGLDANTFTDLFTKEQDMINKRNPVNSWLERDEPHDYQMEYLKENTSYSEEDLSMLQPMEAQCFINIFKKQMKPTSISRKRILTNVYKIPADKIPKRDIDAMVLIKQLSNRRFKYGGA